MTPGSKQWLRHHYVTLNMTAEQCADLVGCSKNAMEQRLYRHKIRKSIGGKLTVLRQSTHPAKKRVIARYKRSGGIFREFASISEASRETGCSKGDIAAVLAGRRKSSGGYSWHYKEKLMAVWSTAS